MRIAQACVAGALMVTSVRAQSGSSQNPIPDFLAATMTLTLSDEISGAHYVIDNARPGLDDSRVSTLKVPWRSEVDVGSRHGSLFLEAVGGLLTAKDGLTLDTPSGTARLEQDWLAFSALGGVGWSFPLGHDWSIRPGCAVALSYLDNEADYNAAAEIELKPILDGVVVNWSAWSVLTNVSATIEHARDPLTLDAGLRAKYVAAWTDVFDATSSLQEGSDTSEFGLVRVDVGGPTPWQVRRERLYWDVFSSWLGIFDVDRTSLGFDQYVELGGGLSGRIFEGTPALRFSASLLAGRDVNGWSAGLSLAL